MMKNNDNKKKIEAFYNSCSKELNSVWIKRFLLNPNSEINSSILVGGLLGAIDKNKPAYIDLIFNYIDSNNFNLDSEFIKVAFNYAVKNNNSKVIDYLDERFSVIKNSLSVEIKETPQVYVKKGKPVYLDFLSFLEDIRDYVINPIIFSAQNNISFLDNFLRKDYELSPSLIRSVFISCVESDHKDAAIYLINHEKTFNFLLNSERIKDTLNFDVRYPVLKQELKMLLNAKEMAQELNSELSSNINSQKKLKV